jgi:hypothetical protein
MVPDLLFAPLLGSGVEHLGAPAGASFRDWRMVTPYSHGGLVALTGVLALAAGQPWRQTAGARAQWLRASGAAVLAHLAGDGLTDPGGLLLFGRGGPRIGFALWHVAPAAAVALEVLAVALGLALFLWATPTRRGWPRFALGAVFAGLTWLSTAGQWVAVAPADAPAGSASYLVQLCFTLGLIAVFATIMAHGAGRAAVAAATTVSRDA